MDKPLIIVESPAKARTIEKFLGRRFVVKASMGHVRDLPRSQFGVDIENGFEPKYITIRGKGEVIKELREVARKAPQVYLATDPDREGEAISWHLSQLLNINDGKCRIVFREITKDAVKKALEQPREIDRKLVEAQQARRILDRLVGYKLSPLLWRKVKRGLSAGRVQSVAIRLICDREDEIEQFAQEEYWTLSGVFSRKEGGPTASDGKGAGRFEAAYYGFRGEKADLRCEEQVNRLMESIQNEQFRVTGVSKKERHRNPPLPFITSTMQQEASRKLGFTVRRTMAVAQQLYEGLKLGSGVHEGLITYMRTDSIRVSETAVKQAREYISGRWGKPFVGSGRQTQRKPGTQDAHEAIRPTSVLREPEAIREHLTRDQFRLYRLIWERFVASQMSPAVYDVSTVEIESDGGHQFRASGSVVRFPGFTAIYTEGQDEGEEEKRVVLPDLAESESLDLDELIPEQHFTQPPPRYTEAMLVKALEEKGIGRPSTYAPIIETILHRGYVLKENKRFKPSELGRVVVAMLKDHFPDIVDVGFTATMESELDQIEEGKDWREVLAQFYRPFSKALSRAEHAIEEVRVPEEESDEICELCGRRMVIKHGKYGRFLACPGFPDCKNAKPLLEKTGVRCPECGLDIVRRRTKKGRTIYGCAGYPKCTFVSWYKPVGTCPVCGGLLVEKGNGRDAKVITCLNDECSGRTDKALDS